MTHGYGLAGAITLVLWVSLLCGLSAGSDSVDTNTVNNNDGLSRTWPTEYDHRRPPERMDGKAVEVNTSVKLHTIHRTDESEGSSDLSLVLREQWVDVRLRYIDKFPLREGEKFVLVDPDHIWTPRLGFRSVTRTRTHFSEARVFPYGHVYLERRVELRVSSAFDFSWFPFDTQHVHLDLYIWAYDTKKIKIVAQENWYPATSELEKDPFSFTRDFQVGKSHWAIMHFKGAVKETAPNDQGQIFSYVSVDLKMRRTPMYYFFTYFIPVMIISLSACTSFFINFEDNGSRISVALSSILALIGMDYVLMSELPRAGYIFWVHIYILGQFVMVIMPLGAHFIVAHFYRTSTDYDLLSSVEIQKKNSSFLQKILWYVKWFFPSGYSSKTVAKIDTIGYFLYLALFLIFNCGMFVIAYFFYVNGNGDS